MYVEVRTEDNFVWSALSFWLHTGSRDGARVSRLVWPVLTSLSYKKQLCKKKVSLMLRGALTL